MGSVREVSRTVDRQVWYGHFKYSQVCSRSFHEKNDRPENEITCAGNKLKWDSGKETFCQKIHGRREDNDMGQLSDLSKC